MNVEKEIEQLKQELGRMKAALAIRTAASLPKAWLNARSECVARLVAQADAAGEAGLLAHYGCLRNESGSQSSTWEVESIPLSRLFAMDTPAVARILSALANMHRIEMLKAVMDKQLTASELSAQVGFAAAGQAYHHLNALQSAGLLAQLGERGVYYSPGKRQVGLLLIMEGVRIILAGDAAFPAK